MQQDLRSNKILDFDSLGADDVEIEPSNTRASGSRPSSDVGRAVTD
jgi:hypothetical protein